MKKKPKISVITVVKNAEKTILNTINSVLSQNYENKEYIVLDGKSKDETTKIIKSKKKYLKKFISTNDSGIYDALNKAIKKCTGKYVAILHSDDIFYNKKIIKKKINYMIKNNLDFTFSNLEVVDNNNKVFRKVISKNYTPGYLKYGIHPPHPTLVMKRSIFKEIGFYSTKYKICSDFDFFAKLFSKNYRWKHFNIMSVKHRRGGKSDTNIFQKILLTNELSEILKKRGIFSLRIFFIIKFILRFIERMR